MRITKNVLLSVQLHKLRLWLLCNQTTAVINIIANASIKAGGNSDATKIKHVFDIEKALNMENIDSYLGINV